MLRVMLWLTGGSTVLVACGLLEPRDRTAWVLIAVGENSHTCGLSAAGEALCWGGVGFFLDPGPLRDSVAPNSALPVRVPGGLRFSTLSVGGLGACALDEDRRAYCWGANQHGEVGDGSYLAKLGPSAVSGGLRWRVLTAGGVHTCGITMESRTYCWGNEFRGALGNGRLTYSSSPTPTPVLTELTFDSIFAGGATTCALVQGGAAYCWGANDYGRLGDGEPPEPGKERATPGPVVGGLRFVALTMGSHTCGVTLDERAYCWGWNRYGQLGDGGATHRSSPVAVASDLRWLSLSAGGFHTCGLSSSGSVYCWGLNSHGQLGDGSTTDSSTPRMVATTAKFRSLSAGYWHTCGLTDAGTALCWGWGEYGQLGNGSFVDSPRPTPVVGHR